MLFSAFEMFTLAFSLGLKTDYMILVKFAFPDILANDRILCVEKGRDYSARWLHQ
jgi:hypothetical protein